MRFVVQRVSKASVSVDENTIGSIQNGFVVLVGVCDTDTHEIADKMIHKLLHLRIFSDENGKTNLDIKNVNGELLIISQFTLYADCRKGNRPSFTNAGKP
ncbi:MAG: D-tyrosyl-tRNA(Tyr) deacylase, partial [Lachnospiraceae bacterium]|nr:D-tyrosyl-tRNA(Tyr) deacylase [Lachnospiraceae bacterium]